MTYQEFLNLITNGANLIINNIGRMANMLISNYFIITIIGVYLFIYITNIILDIINSIKLNKEQEKKKDIY